MKTKKMFWQKNVTKQSVIISNRTIVHPFLDESAIKDIADIPRSVWNKKTSTPVYTETISLYFG